jgi:hypothetical protein
MITTGTLLLDKGTPIPPFFRVGSERYPNGWTSVTTTTNFQDREKELATAGWTFFYMAGEMKATAYGFDTQKATDVAVGRLMARARQQACNGLEIDEVLTHSFLGMPYVSVTAHTRHIQEGWLFRPTRVDPAGERVEGRKP